MQPKAVFQRRYLHSDITSRLSAPLPHSLPSTKRCPHHSPDKPPVSAGADDELCHARHQPPLGKNKDKVGDPQKQVGSSSTHTMMWWWQWPLTPGHLSATASAQESASAALLDLLHPSSWGWRFFRTQTEAGCWVTAGCLTALVIKF